MNGNHVTLGEADAEAELNVRFEDKASKKKRHRLCPHCSRTRR
jgi:hypothetical protein